MHSLLDRSVLLRYGYFELDFRSLLRVIQSLSERYIDKECICIWCNFQACRTTGLQRYRARIRTLGSSLVYSFIICI